MARRCRGSTSSPLSTRPCCTPCRTQGSTSPAFAGANCCRTSACSRQPDCRDNCAGCSTSGSPNASPEPTATTSPRPDVSDLQSGLEKALDDKIKAARAEIAVRVTSAIEAIPGNVFGTEVQSALVESVSRRLQSELD